MENRGFIMSRFYDAKKNKDRNSTLTGLMITSGVILAILVILGAVGVAEGEPHMVVVSVIVGLIALAELISMIWIRKMLERVTRYEMIFEEDHDGIITFERINEMTGYGLEQVKKDIKWLLDRGFLKNAVYDGEKVILWMPSSYVRLYDIPFLRLTA
jgi:hypothetical protein